MMKYITHSLAALLLTLAFSLNGQDVEISIDHPARVNAGADFELTVTITKGSLTDYSRFSQDLPQGLTATNVSSPNADFSFDEQRVRIIWLKLPESNEVKVSYKVSVDARLKGTFTLTGVFAYVVNDERKFLKVNEQEPITIVPNSSIDQSLIVNIEDFKGGKPPAVAPVATAASTQATTPGTTPATTPAQVSGSGESFAMGIRQKPLLENSGAYLIHLLIKNPPGSKYAKVEETIPSGYMFQEISSHDGLVSFAASTVKFIWMKMPDQPEFEVRYRLVPKVNESQGNMYIDGLLTYTAANENKVADIVEMDVNLDNLSTSQKRALLATGQVPQGARTPVPVQTETRPPATNTNMETASSGLIANTKVLDRGSGVYYRVQLTANLNPFDARTFYRNIGVEKEVFVEQHAGYYKYTVGPFQTYDQALSYKDKVERYQEIRGAFVVGYNNGNRVSAGALR